jgi:hypothetical protein
MKRALLLVLLLLLPSAAGAAGPNERQVVMALTEVATGTPVSVSVLNQNHTTGYLVVKTENETPTASMVVTVFNTTELGDVLVCTMAAITTDTTTVALLGSLAAGSQEGVTDACDYPLGRIVKITFTTSGGSADFDVTADIEWVVK